MAKEEQRLWAVEQLRLKQQQIGRTPRKDDFDVATLSRIKAFLGPWPRALEASGLKEAKNVLPKSKKRRQSAGANISCHKAPQKPAKAEKQPDQGENKP